jgi:hypothetical protein
MTPLEELAGWQEYEQRQIEEFNSHYSITKRREFEGTVACIECGKKFNFKSRYGLISAVTKALNHAADAHKSSGWNRVVILNHLIFMQVR